MERKVLIIHDYSTKGSGEDIEQVITRRVREAGPGWFVHSATTSVAICPNYNLHIYVQWCTTVVIEKK